MSPYKESHMLWKSFLLSLLVFAIPLFSHSQDLDELKDKINSHGGALSSLESEIEEYKRELKDVSSQANTLDRAVTSLNISQKKIGTDIKVTENRIGSAELNLQKLSLEIGEKEVRIERNKKILQNTLRAINENDQVSFVELFLIEEDISEVWEQMDILESFQKQLGDQTSELIDNKQVLNEKHTETLDTKVNLEDLKEDLDDQKRVVAYQRQEKQELLNETKNKEENYKELLEEKERLRDIFEKELLEFETQLRVAIDPESIPPAGTKALLWPVEDHSYITQHFGHTAFSKSGKGAVYNGQGHNGMDIGVITGTPVLSPASGIITAVGNTDLACPNASYGKWLLMAHENGLSTLYAHLSLHKATPGQTVSAGETIAFSGSTGFSTGPHLHFTVMASQGVQIVERPSRACGGRMYTLPVAPLDAYLNPEAYL
jgi:murein DD-endopeptidase MepM/ murein hydrolase activator NlpD